MEFNKESELVTVTVEQDFRDCANPNELDEIRSLSHTKANWDGIKHDRANYEFRPNSLVRRPNVSLLLFG